RDHAGRRRAGRDERATAARRARSRQGVSHGSDAAPPGTRTGDLRTRCRRSPSPRVDIAAAAARPPPRRPPFLLGLIARACADLFPARKVRKGRRPMAPSSWFSVRRALVRVIATLLFVTAVALAGIYAYSGAHGLNHVLHGSVMSWT